MYDKEMRGLTKDEVEKKIKQFGLNVLQSKEKISALKIFLSQFNDFIIWVLIGATIISGIMGDLADAITILIIVFMNAILGFVQEFKTEKSLEALKEMAAPTAKVIRNGKVEIVNSMYLVPGDLLILESGDKVQADAILLEDNSFMVDESLLTGESVGVYKDSKENKSNAVYMGTTVLTGKGIAKVLLTGMNTEMGKIAHMLNSIDTEKSVLREKLDALGKILVVMCLVICTIVTVLGIVRGQDPYTMFLSGVTLAVAAIPEGLAAIVTVALALGVSRMLDRQALVRKLPAVETLGCTSIICTDKTGTLTENKMVVKKFYFDGNIYDESKNQNEILKKIFVYCNNCDYNFQGLNIDKCLFGDPTETALIKAFFKSPKELQKFISKVRREFEIPFNSTKKMMSVVVNEDGKETCYVKGAPEMLLNKCTHILINGNIEPFTYTYKKSVEKAIDDMSYDALRCIAGAYKIENIIKKENDLECNLIFAGIAGIIDPPRKEAKDSVIECKMAGIKPIMITGDHKNTAYAIGKQLEICNSLEQVITGEELDRFSDKQLKDNIDSYRVFARVNPKHKLRIVKTFKSKGKIVAMSGDGVNDAPAVKEADIGVAMGISGTDVTKEAASMILLDDNYSTIVAAVEEGRKIYDNIRKFIRYLLSCNLGEVLTMFLASLFYLETPLLPIQILFVNLVTDGLPAIALGVDPGDKDIMMQKPREKNESIFARGLKEKIILRGSLIGICTVMAFIAGKYYGMSLETCRTLALGTLIMSQLIHVFECRSERYSLFEINPFTNMYLIGAVGLSLLSLIAIVYMPIFQKIFKTVSLDLGQWLIILFFSGTIAFINSLYIFLSHKNKK